jgi:cation diffusion facilitator CzcD-associated flavoprotein CzcO
MHNTSEHRFDTIVIGGDQAGLAVGYHLAHQDRDFVILDAASWVVNAAKTSPLRGPVPALDTSTVPTNGGAA